MVNERLNMEIKIEVWYRNETHRWMESHKVETETYDQYSYPEDFLHAEIERMRTEITNKVNETKNHLGGINNDK